MDRDGKGERFAPMGDARRGEPDLASTVVLDRALLRGEMARLVRAGWPEELRVDFARHRVRPEYPPGRERGTEGSD